ncbi:MAG: palindromic element RPE4 domain-containing protein [Rickettsia endosymbiont of Stiretrus anchorago]|nr:palindromic element RPE4 domain-containing protein [Rickettsia endosymbiont of Stiretrus anchorago]
MTLSRLIRVVVIPWFVHGGHCPCGSFSPCHPVIYSRDPVRNTNKISIFYYFLDTVDKPRYDYLRAFFDPRNNAATGFRKAAYD